MGEKKKETNGHQCRERPVTYLYFFYW